MIRLCICISIYAYQVGIILGSGLGDFTKKIFNVNNIMSRENAKNDFGYPSSDLHHGCVDGVNVTLLFR
jgi:5'-methylthioadenosine phosphorylase